MRKGAQNTDAVIVEQGLSPQVSAGWRLVAVGLDAMPHTGWREAMADHRVSTGGLVVLEPREITRVWSRGECAGASSPQQPTLGPVPVLRPWRVAGDSSGRLIC